MTSAPTRWRDTTADQRRAAMRVVIAGRERKALDPLLDKLTRWWPSSTPEQRARVAALLARENEAGT